MSGPNSDSHLLGSLSRQTSEAAIPNVEQAA